jgi:lipopolysaccharide transport system permease protein
VMEDVVQTISPKKTGSFSRTFSDIWAYRELLYFFVWKEIKIRYKQTAIGIGWAVLQPLITMMISWFLFGIVLKVDTDGLPYPIFAFSALVVWTYFSTSLNQASGSIVQNTNLLTKVYFPRILLPLSNCLIGLLDYAIASIILVILMLIFHIVLSFWMLLFFIPLILTLLLVSGLGFWLSATSAKYRDVRIIIPFFVTLLYFVTPVAWSGSQLPEQYQWVITYNPLAAIVKAQRGFLLGSGLTDWVPLGIAAIISILVFLGGILFFSRYERELADVI